MELSQDRQNEIHRMDMLRAVLPYIPISMQRFLSIYLGFEELFHAIQIIRNGPILYMEPQDYQQNKLGNTDELVKVLRGFCSPKENEMIDMFFQMSNMMNMYDQYKDVFSMFSAGEGTQQQASSKSAEQPVSSSGMNPASIMNMMNQMNQFKESSEIDALFKDFQKSQEV